MTGTLGRVPQNRGVVSDADLKEIRDALAAREENDKKLRAAVLTAVSHGSSVRMLAAATGLAPSTISRWKRGE